MSKIFYFTNCKICKSLLRRKNLWYLCFFYFTYCSKFNCPLVYNLFDLNHGSGFDYCQKNLENIKFSKVDLYLNIEYDCSYPFQNFIFNVKLEGPEKHFFFDKSNELQLFDNSFGKPKGKRLFFSKNFRISYLIIENLNLNDTKSLKVYIEQMMRKTRLIGIQKISVELRKKTIT